MIFGNSLRRLGLRSRGGQMAFGAGTGAAYGLMSSDTSMESGALKGLGLAIGARTGYAGYKGASAAYKNLNRLNSKFGSEASKSDMFSIMAKESGRAMWSSAKTNARVLEKYGRQSVSYIGNTAKEAYINIRGLHL